MKKQKLTNSKALIFLVILFFSIFCQCYIASAQASVAVRIEPSTVSARLGESFTVTISLSNVQNLYGIEVILKWNPAILRATNVDVRLGIETFSEGVLHESLQDPPIFIAKNNLTQNMGEYMLVATSMAPAPSFNGGGNIFRITFEAIGLGDSEFNLESQLFDYPPVGREPRVSLPIDHTAMDSIVKVEASTVTPSPTPSPTSSPTSSPTTTPTMSPSPTPEPPTLNIRIEHLLILLVIIVIVMIATLITHRKTRKIEVPNLNESQQRISLLIRAKR